MKLRLSGKDWAVILEGNQMDAEMESWQVDIFDPAIKTLRWRCCHNEYRYKKLSDIYILLYFIIIYLYLNHIYIYGWVLEFAS